MCPINPYPEIDRNTRIQNLEHHIEHINSSIYPDNYREVKEVMLTALAERIRQIKKEN